MFDIVSDTEKYLAICIHIRYTDYMSRIPLDQLLVYQTLIVQELGIYLNDDKHLPKPREYVLLSDIRSRAEDTRILCRYLEIEFWNRMRE